MIKEDDFLDIVSGKSKDNNTFKMAKISPNYSGGKPSVIFDGEDIVTQKQYVYLSSYTPQANDRVVMVKVKNSYVILGKVVV